MDQIRRLLPRQFTDWRGKYTFEDNPVHQRRDCRVLDVSSAGAGLQLLETDDGAIVGDHIALAVQSSRRAPQLWTQT
jgi:hypothetical protein